MNFPDPSSTKEITVPETANLMENAENSFLLIDCREPDEYDICNIDGSDLAPLSNFDMEVETLFADEAECAIVYCHHGGRSLKAVDWLRAKGYENTFSLKGGIDLWAQEVDTELPRY